jgi:putative ABC transport system permease protein
VTGIPRLQDVALDQSAVIVALLLTAGCGALIGLVPAWRATSPELRDGLASGGRGATADRSLAQRTMVVLQVALAVMLVVGASLLVRSFATLLGERPGFDSHRVTTVTLSLPEDRYTDSLHQLGYFDRVLSVAAGVPGVTQAAILNSASMPYTGSGGVNGAVISDDHPPADAGLNPFYRLASPGLFATLKIPVLRGRDFSAADRPGTLPVAIVTQSVASHYWPHANPIGHRIKWIPAFDNHDDWLTIVGVVPDTRSEVGDPDGGAAVYVDYAQRPERSLEGMTVLLKTPHPSRTLTAALRSALRGVDPDVPMVFSTIDATMNASVAYRRFVMYVMTAFGGFALFLAGLSLYGLLSYSVTRRRREIGVRMALGSTVGGVLRLVVGEGMRMVMGGVVIGVAAAIALTRTMASLLYGVTSTDVASFVASVGVLFGAALLACYLPARRAAAIDPLAATRAD